MKKSLFSLMVLAAIIFVFSCSPSQAEKSAVINLSPAGEAWAGIVMTAPEGARLSEGLIASTVDKGGGFQIEVSTGGTPLAEKKKEIAANDVNKLKRYEIDKPDAILYSSDTRMGEEWHFAAVVTVREDIFYFEDVKGFVYSKAEAEAMLKAALSAKKEMSHDR